MELAIRERDRILLLSLREALVRIERGRFGICESCGGAISIKRMLANPAAKVCIECKAQEEIPRKRGLGLSPSTV
jgi:DnaK suppressor protein